jgi:hypothetical protein
MLRLISDQNFSGRILRGIGLRIPHLDLVRALDAGLAKAPGAQDSSQFDGAPTHSDRGGITMKTMTFTAQIAADGKLRLELPTGLPPGPADVVVVVHPKPSSQLPRAQSLVGLFAAPDPPGFDAVAEVREIRRRATQEAEDELE